MQTPKSKQILLQRGNSAKDQTWKTSKASSTYSRKEKGEFVTTEFYGAAIGIS